MQMACSLMKAARGSGAGAWVKLVSLEKVWVEKSDEGYPSTFDCDYNAEYKSTNPSLQKMLELGDESSSTAHSPGARESGLSWRTINSRERLRTRR